MTLYDDVLDICTPRSQLVVADWRLTFRPHVTVDQAQTIETKADNELI